jgi:hypothetical protein
MTLKMALGAVFFCFARFASSQKPFFALKKRKIGKADDPLKNKKESGQSPHNVYGVGTPLGVCKKNFGLAENFSAGKFGKRAGCGKAVENFCKNCGKNEGKLWSSFWQGQKKKAFLAFFFCPQAGFFLVAFFVFLVSTPFCPEVFFEHEEGNPFLMPEKQKNGCLEEQPKLWKNFFSLK